MCSNKSYQPVPPPRDPAELLAEAERRKKLVCEHCGKPMVRHIIKNGSRFHVTSWYNTINGGTSHCSEPNCENNHGEGHCVPYSQETKKKIAELERKYKKPTATGIDFQEDYLR